MTIIDYIDASEKKIEQIQLNISVQRLFVSDPNIYPEIVATAQHILDRLEDCLKEYKDLHRKLLTIAAREFNAETDRKRSSASDLLLH